MWVMWETSCHWLDTQNTEDFMGFALIFFFSEKISFQEDRFSYALKPYFSRHNEAQAPNDSEISSDRDNIHPPLSQILQETS